MCIGEGVCSVSPVLREIMTPCATMTQEGRRRKGPKPYLRLAMIHPQSHNMQTASMSEDWVTCP